MNAGRLLALALLVVLCACGSLSPPPQDNYYRLTPANSIAPVEPSANLIEVGLFQASGLHAERALVWAHNDETRLAQYSYHYWVDSPRVLLQQALIEHLTNVLGARALPAPLREARFAVDSRIVRFEHVRGDKGNAAVAVFEFQVSGLESSVPLFKQRYAQSIALSDDTISSLVSGLDAATNAIFQQFSSDFRALDDLSE